MLQHDPSCGERRFSNDVIRVGKGTYREDVLVTKPLSLLGDNTQNTVIDATGLLNAINVDGGHDGAHLDGVAHVIISGFTVRKANA